MPRAGHPSNTKSGLLNMLLYLDCNVSLRGTLERTQLDLVFSPVFFQAGASRAGDTVSFNRPVPALNMRNPAKLRAVQVAMSVGKKRAKPAPFYPVYIQFS